MEFLAGLTTENAGAIVNAEQSGDASCFFPHGVGSHPSFSPALVLSAACVDTNGRRPSDSIKRGLARPLRVGTLVGCPRNFTLPSFPSRKEPSDKGSYDCNDSVAARIVPTGAAAARHWQWRDHAEELIEDSSLSRWDMPDHLEHLEVACAWVWNEVTAQGSTGEVRGWN